MDGRDRMPAAATGAMREAAARVLASEAFRGAPQLSAFLDFIVARAVAGRAGELKGYTIAVEALGRPADFNPQLDPIVRVEAGRLRRALAQYYAGEGARDPWRLTVPLGGYVPLLEQAPPAAEGGRRPPAAAPTAFGAFAGEVGAGPREAAAAERAGGAFPRFGAMGKIAGRRLRGGLLVALPLLLLGLSGLAVWLSGRGETPAGASHAVSTGARLPAVAVMIDEATDDADLGDIVQSFERSLVDALARFDDVISVRQVQTVEGADYALEISSRRAVGTVETFLRLRGTGDSRIVWAASRVYPFSGPNDPALADLARAAAARLAEPYGILHADLRQNAQESGAACIAGAIEARRTLRPGAQPAARACLEGILAADPLFQPAWAHLALMLLDEHVLGAGTGLDAALNAALTAIRLGPSSARAQQALMEVLFARGAGGEALAAGHAALTRNPHDPEIMAALGARYVQSNRPEQGLPLLDKAIAASGGRPAWYDFYGMVGGLLTGSGRPPPARLSLVEAHEGVYGLLGRALLLSAPGQEGERARLLARLCALAPVFAPGPRAVLERLGFARPVVDRLVAELAGQAPAPPR